MEMWIQRALDNRMIVGPSTVLHMIEGITGQNGNAFTSGPGPRGTAEVFLTNLVLFGKDPYRLDVLGHWLGGHEVRAPGLQERRSWMYSVGRVPSRGGSARVFKQALSSLLLRSLRRIAG